ncbi:30S ribosomal protein S18 [Candidatus Vidania fulgoroideorum]
MINYRYIEKLKKYIYLDGSIIPKKENKVKTKKQKLIAKHIKIARFLSLIPYIRKDKR